MKLNAPLVAAILLMASASSGASEVDLKRVEKQVSFSTYQLIKEDPKTAALPDEKVLAFSSIVAKHTVSCFRERTRNSSEADLTAFEGAITTYDNIYNVNDWGTFVRGRIEKDYGLKWSSWRCDEEHSPTSPNCRAVRSFFEVSMGLHSVLTKCLLESGTDPKAIALLDH